MTRFAPLRSTATDSRRSRVDAAIVAIDRLLGEQLDAILHHPRLQQLEALWRNTAWLVRNCAVSRRLSIQILDAQWDEIARDLERRVTPDQSQLYDKLYSQAIGKPGGDPIGLLVVDHAFSHRPANDQSADDVDVVGWLAEISAKSFCPIVMSAHPGLLGMDSFENLDLRQQIDTAFGLGEYQRFHQLRSAPDTRFVSIVLPRVLVRTPHRGRSFARLGFRYDETVDKHEDLLWGSAAFGMAAAALRAMARFGWPAGIRGAWSGGVGGIVDGPARLLLPGDRPGVVARFPTENAVSETQELALNRSGVIALRQCHLTGSAAFFNVPSLHAPRGSAEEYGEVNARMGAMLNYVLCVCRFAHYIKVIARDWAGSFTTADECQHKLQDWINDYVIASDDTSEEDRATYPLRQAEIVVTDEAGAPGAFLATVSLRPHFQLDQTNADFQLSTVIGRPVER